MGQRPKIPALPLTRTNELGTVATSAAENKLTSETSSNLVQLLQASKPAGGAR